MYRFITLTMLVAGGLLLIAGTTATASVSGSLARLFASGPVDKASWMLLSGGALILLGMAGLLRGSHAER